MLRTARLLTFVALLLAAGCGGAPQIPAHKERLMIWGVNFNPEGDTKGLETLIDEFKRRNPDLEVRVLSMGAGAMQPQKLMTAIVGNVAPDVILQDRFTIGDWASRGAFRSLDDLIARDKNDPLCPHAAQFYPPLWAEASFDGKVYAIPTSADNRALYWNKKIFRENGAGLRAAGLDPERAPRTWSELLAYSKVLTKRNPDGTLKLAGFMPNFGNCWLYMYAFQNDAPFLSADGKSCTLGSSQVAEALRFVVKGYEVEGGYEVARSFESGFLQNENDAFMIGKVAMKIDGDWILNQISRYAPSLDFGTVPAPVPDDRYNRTGKFKGGKDQFVTWTGGAAVAIPRGARNVEGAWRYIKFTTSVEGLMIQSRAQQEWERRKGRTFIPREVSSRVANEKLFQTFKPADPKFAAALAVHVELMKHARTRPVTLVGQRLWDEHVRAMENACYKKVSPEQALSAGQRVVQRELDGYFRRTDFPVIDLNIPAYVAVLSAVVGGVILALLYRRKRLLTLARAEARWAYWFLSPWAIGFLVFTFGPMIASLFFSFTNYNVLSDARWVGFKNYTDLVTSDRVNTAKAFSNAAYLAVVGVPLSLFTGLAIALLLNATVRGMRVYRTLFYMPAIVPTVASAVLWTWVLAPDPTRGLVNAAWGATISSWFGTPLPGWIMSEVWAKPALIMMGLWGAGSGMILWLAGLKGVPTQLYEAASIDGASPRQQFWGITLPQLSPIIFFSTVMGFIGAFQEFDRVYVMKPGDEAVGPADSLLVPVYQLFSNGFSYFKMGYASAIAWLIFAIILVLTLLQFKLAPRWVHYEAEE